MGCERTEHDDAATLNASSIKCFGQGDFVLGGIDAFTLASDTAQSIDKGVAFRIQSIRALFYTHLADPEHEAFRSRLTQSLIDSLEAFHNHMFSANMPGGDRRAGTKTLPPDRRLQRDGN